MGSTNKSYNLQKEQKSLYSSYQVCRALKFDNFLIISNYFLRVGGINVLSTLIN